MGDSLTSAEIGNRIRELRQQAGLSQEKLAEMVGVSFQQIQKYERGHTTLNILKLQSIAKALKVTISDIFESLPSGQVSLTPQEEELLKSFRRIRNDEMKNCILKLVRNINKKVTY